MLGPEARLIAFGLTCGFLAARAVNAGPEATQVIPLIITLTVAGALLAAWGLI